MAKSKASPAPAGKDSKKKSGSSSGKKGESAKAASKKRQAENVPPPPPPAPPIRREVTGVVLLLLGCFIVISYFNVDGSFIAFFREFLSGLTGWGYWVSAPVFIIAAVILFFHGGKPVTLRVTVVLLLPVLLAAVIHLLSCQPPEGDFDLILTAGDYYAEGVLFKSGGTLGGLLAVGLELALSVYGALPVLLVTICLFIVIGFNVSPLALLSKARDYKPQPYDPALYEEPEEERSGTSVPSFLKGGPKAPEKETKKKDPVKVERINRSAFQMDLPLGDEEELLPVMDSGYQNTEPYAPEPGPRARAKVRRKPAAAEPTAKVEPLPVDDAAKMAGVDVGDGFLEYPVPSKMGKKPVVPVAAEISDPPKSKKLSREELAAETKAVEDAVQSSPEQPDYQFPPLELLKGGSGASVDAREEILLNRERLEGAIRSFGISAAIVGVIRGPTVTRYDIELDQGVKLARVTNLAGDLALALGVVNVRIAPIPDKISTVGIEVPNKITSPVLLRDIIETPKFANAKSKLSFAVGKDISGEAVVGNIAKLPHMLIAGTTGSGKSVCMNSLILSLLYKARPDEVRLIMIDPKMVELGIYNGIPHLYVPVVTDPKKAAGALQWSVVEMLKRYRLFSEIGVRDLETYNRHCAANGEQTLPQVVIVIDELADLMLVASKEVEESICRVAQMGRAAGMHLVIATQRPSADVITGLMKANIPSRIAFAVSSSLESRIILDQTGAEKLVGMGDMLFSPVGSGKPTRIQGAFVSDEERENVISFIKEHTGGAQQNSEIEEYMNKAAQDKSSSDSGKSAKEEESAAGGYDEMLPQAVEVVLELGSCSVSMLQRRIKLGYSRAARIVDQMEELGVVGPYEGAKPRAVVIDRQGWHELQVQLGLTEDGGDMTIAAEMNENDDFDFEE